jgi:hypothetical protein
VLGAQFEEIEEQVGQALLPVLQDLAQALIDAMPAIEAFVNALGKIPAISPGIIQLLGRFSELQTTTADFAEELGPVADKAIAFGKDLYDKVRPQVEIFAGNILGLGKDTETLGEHFQATSKKMGTAAKDIGDALIKEIPAIRGTVTTYKETFDITPAEFRHITSEWAKIARTISSDLREIAQSDLTPSMRKAIADLPPEMRHAWVEGNDAQRAAIENSIQKTYKFEDQIPALARQALTGGREVGHAMVDGIVQGAESGRGTLQSTMASIVKSGIDAARNAAGAHSPSTVMAEFGRDMMKGLELGLNDYPVDIGTPVMAGSIAATSGRGGGNGTVINLQVGTVVGPGGIADVADQLRRELIRTGSRNPDIFGGRA